MNRHSLLGWGKIPVCGTTRHRDRGDSDEPPGEAGGREPALGFSRKEGCPWW